MTSLIVSEADDAIRRTAVRQDDIPVIMRNTGDELIVQGNAHLYTWILGKIAIIISAALSESSAVSAYGLKRNKDEVFRRWRENRR